MLRKAAEVLLECCVKQLDRWVLLKKSWYADRLNEEVCWVMLLLLDAAGL
jgi:hypothetical protein